MEPTPTRDDFRDMLLCLNGTSVEYLIVGAFAVGLHGLVRATKDLDLWIRPTPENARKLWEALDRFGAPLAGLGPTDLIESGTGFQVGVAPVRIDLLNAIEPLRFDEAWKHRLQAELLGVSVGVLCREHLLASKRAAGRPQDLVDVDRLENEIDPDSRV